MKPILSLDQYQFKIFPNDRVAVLGPSGAGKSDFLKALTHDQTIVFDNGLIGKDPISAVEWLREISDTGDSRAVVVVLPSISWAKRFANRVVGIQSGKIVFDGAVDELGDEAFRKIYVSEQVLKTDSVSATVPVSSRSKTAPFPKYLKKQENSSALKSSLYLGAGLILGSLLTLGIQKLMGFAQ